MDAPCPNSVRVSFRVGGELLVPGATVRFKAVLMPPPAPASPGDYDFGRAAWFEGLGAVGYAYGAPDACFAAAVARFLRAHRGRVSSICAGG